MQEEVEDRGKDDEQDEDEDADAGACRQRLAGRSSNAASSSFLAGILKKPAPTSSSSSADLRPPRKGVPPV